MMNPVLNYFAVYRIPGLKNQVSTPFTKLPWQKTTCRYNLTLLVCLHDCIT